jgi:hypothetical protein
MIDEVRKLIDEYVGWLREKTTLRQVGEWVEVTTPYLDRHNDHLQIYVKREDGEFVLTDDGYVIGDLRACGCDLDAGSRKQLLQMALNGFGVQEQDDALVVRATGGNFACRKHNLVQAMLAVDDLFCLAHPMVASLFREDVTAWLELHGVRYSTGIKIAGRSGLDHVFDFLITKSPKAPERLLRAITHPSPDKAKSLAFAWLDLCDSRPPGARAYALLNDAERAPDPSVVGALERYNVRPVLWSAREEVAQELAA